MIDQKGVFSEPHEKRRTMIEAVIFDLDDTLYPEIAYIRSGFSVVAEVLARRGFGPYHEILALLEFIHWDIDRDRVFQHAAQRLGFDWAWIPELIRLVRCHEPQIDLSPATREILSRLCQRFRLGIVTDGHREVQYRKLAALGLTSAMDVIVCSDELGRPFWKPDPLPFLTACRSLKIHPANAIFVGDHPYRDIWGAARLGMKTVRVTRYNGYFRNMPDIPDAIPQARIADLCELPDCLPRLLENSHNRHDERTLEAAA